MTYHAQRPYREAIIDLEKQRDYQGANALLQQSLIIYPTDKFLLRTKIFLLLKLHQVAQASSCLDI